MTAIPVHLRFGTLSRVPCSNKRCPGRDAAGDTVHNSHGACIHCGTVRKPPRDVKFDAYTRNKRRAS